MGNKQFVSMHDRINEELRIKFDKLLADNNINIDDYEPVIEMGWDNKFTTTVKMSFKLKEKP